MLGATAQNKHNTSFKRAAYHPHRLAGKHSLDVWFNRRTSDSRARTLYKHAEVEISFYILPGAPKPYRFMGSTL